VFKDYLKVLIAKKDGLVQVQILTSHRVNYNDFACVYFFDTHLIKMAYETD